VAFPIEPKLPDSEMTHEMLAAGVQGMSASVVAHAAEQLIANDSSVATVGWIDWESFEQAHRIRAGRPLFEGVVSVRSSTSGPGQLRRRIATAEPQKARRMIEEVMRKEFARLLGQTMNDLPSTDDALSALGMDSIMVLQALASIGSALGITLPVRILLNRPTFDGLAESIANMLRSTDDRDGGESASLHTGGSNLLVELVSTGTKRPFFCVSPMNGSALYYQSVAQHWDYNRKFYGFNAPGYDTDASPCDKVEILAGRYIEIMRQVVPQGPYLIGGFSFGCFVAFEMARMLQRSGEGVDACLLIDPPAAPGSLDVSPLLALSRFFDIPLDEATFEKLNRDEQITAISNSVGQMLGLPPDLGESNQQLRVYRAHLHAMLDYVPEKYDGPLTVLPAHETAAKAQQGGVFVEDASFGWGSLCTRGVSVSGIPGNHATTLAEPLAREVAQVMCSVLDQVDSS
jgi:thioesterase domain-containing protein